MDNYNPVTNTLIAFKVPLDFKRKMLGYGQSHDLTISQIARRAIKAFLDETTGAAQRPKEWSIGG